MEKVLEMNDSYKRRVDLGMFGDEYQHQAGRTLLDKPDDGTLAYAITNIMLVWNGLGLVGEAGEVADTIKKGVFHGHGIDKEKIEAELGDVLWYVAGICSNLGLSMSDVMQRNIEKLKIRYPDGFNSDDSKKRADEFEVLLKDIVELPNSVITPEAEALFLKEFGSLPSIDVEKIKEKVIIPLIKDSSSICPRCDSPGFGSYVADFCMLCGYDDTEQ